MTDTTGRITWQTDEPAAAAVHFGLGLASEVGVLGLATEHAILVTGLDPATTYAFEAVSRDASGNVGAVAGSWTTTSPAPRITSVVPSRAAQGASLELTVSGEHFGADAQVDLGAGVAVGVAGNAAGTQLRATIAVASAAAHCRPAKGSRSCRAARRAHEGRLGYVTS